MLPVFGLYHAYAHPNPCPPSLSLPVCAPLLLIPGLLGLLGLVSSVWVAHRCTVRGPCLLVGIAPVI